VKYAEVDLYASSPHWQQLLFSASGLQSGTHTITIKPTNQKNTSSTGYYTAVDAFDVYESSFSFIDPNNNDLWDIQVGHLVRLAINYKLGTSQYRLYRKCGLDTWSTSNMITLRACDYYGVCPSYTWLPPLITGQYTVLPCQLAAQLLDSNFKVIDTAISDIFGLEPPEGIAGFSISPLSPDVAGGGSQVFTINGGVPPYTVGTLLNLPVNPGISQLQENYDVTAFQHCSTSTNIICAADGDCPAGPPAETCVTTAGRLHLPSTHTFKIKNSGSCTQVVIVAQDSTKSRTSALYNISCP